MKEKRYTIPNEHNAAVYAAEPAVTSARIADLHSQLIDKVMTIQNPEVLHTLIMYVDQNILNQQDCFETDWKRSISIEDFRMQCKNKLKKMNE